MMVVKNQNNNENEDYDSKGWTEIHSASAHGYCDIVEKLINAKSSRLELITLDKKQVTPLWLAFRGGHFETANLLLSLGAKTDVTDTRNIGIIEIAVKKEQYKFLLHLINDKTSLTDSIFTKLFQFLTPDTIHMQKGEIILHQSLFILKELSYDQNQIERLVNNDIVGKLLSLYKPTMLSNYPAFEKLFLQVIFNVISLHDTEVSTYGKVFDIITTRLIENENQELHKITLNILHLKCQKAGFINYFMNCKHYDKLQEFLSKNITDDDILIEVLQIFQQGLKVSKDLQEYLHQVGATVKLMLTILTTNNNKNCKANCIEVLTFYVVENEVNQLDLLQTDIFTHIKNLMLDTKCKKLINGTADFIISSCQSNYKLQEHLIGLGIVESMTSLTHKYKGDNIIEPIVQALWTIAGENYKNKILVSRTITIENIVELATTNASYTLEFYCYELLQSITRLSFKTVTGHEKLIKHLLNSLKLATLEPLMLISCLKALSALCLYSGYRPNVKNQEILFQRQGITTLLQLFLKLEDDVLRLYAIKTLGLVTLGSNKKIVNAVDAPNNANPSEVSIDFLDILSDARPENQLRREIKNLIKKSLNKSDKIKKQLAYQILAIANLRKSFNADEIRREIELNLNDFVIRLEANDDIQTINAAFEMVSLQEFILGTNPSNIAMDGINVLIGKLKHETCDEILGTTSEYLGAMAYYRRGIKEALVSADIIKILCELLVTKEDETVKISLSAVLITLSLSLKGEIELLLQCRKQSSIYNLLAKYGSFAQFTTRFRKKWKHYVELKNDESLY